MQIMGIDILPAELPIESSTFFGQSLYPYIKELVLLHLDTRYICRDI